MTQRHSRIALAFGLSAFYLALCLFAPIQFSQNDDSVMMMLASGEYSGTPSAYLVFINYYLGLVLAQLYTMTDAVNWYPLLFVVLHAAAILIVIQSILFRDDLAKHFRILMCGLILAVDVLMVLRLQFTTTTAVAMTGAIALMVSQSRTVVIAGGLLMVLAILIRFEAAALVGLISAPFILYQWLRMPHKAFRLVAFIVAIAVGLALHVSSQQTYVAQGNGYQEYNKIRGRLNDNPSAMSGQVTLPDGIGAHDYFLLLNFFQDTNILDFDALNAVMAAVEQVERDVRKFNPRGVLDRKLVYGIVPVLLLVLMLSYARQRLVLMAMAAILLICFLYISNTALLKDRVVFSGFMPLLLALGTIGPHRQVRWGKAAGVVTLSALICAMIAQLATSISNSRDRHAYFLEQFEMVQKIDRPIVVYGGDYHVQGNRVFRNFKRHDPQKIVFRGWMTLHPDNLEFAGLDDFIRKDFVLLIRKIGFDELIAPVLTALRVNYGIEATYEVLESSEYVRVLAFRAK